MIVRERYGFTFIVLVCIFLQCSFISKLIWSENDQSLNNLIQCCGSPGSSSLGVVTCAANTTIPNQVFFPDRLFWHRNFKAFQPNFFQNKALLKDNYIIFGDRSSTSSFSVYYHLHKVGGTTMEHLSTPLAKENLNWATENKIGKDLFDQKVTELLDDIRQREGVLFTFARDPVGRFLSALRQLLSMPQRHYKLSPCQKQKTSLGLVQCVLDKIDQKGSFLDPHFVPQVYGLYSAVHKQRDIGIQIFGLPSLDDFLISCSKSNITRYRDGKSLARGFPNLSVDSLTPRLRKKICKLYHMDVLLLQALNGLIPTLCLPTG